MNPAAEPYRIGVDLGGTKCAGALLDPGGREVRRTRVKTPRGDYDGTIRAVVDLIAELAQDAPAQPTVGVDMPGIIDPRTQTVKNSNATWIQGHAFQEDLEKVLGQPVRVANDGNCFTIAEARDGAAAGAAVVFGATLGTGCGGGVVVNGAVLTGNNGIAGEWGHSPLPWADKTVRKGRPCFCGQKDCLEQYLSGGGLARTYRDLSGRKIKAKEISALLAEKDANAVSAIGIYEDRLARALAAVVNILDPDVIVLGGGVSNVERLYDNVPRLIGTYAFSDRIETPVVKAKHGDAGGVRGAAWLW
ncbi:MAG: ROK family protein [Rhodospirillales bacterium]|nr:ROK family protein [Rhodospirillales bacterium]